MAEVVAEKDNIAQNSSRENIAVPLLLPPSPMTELFSDQATTEPVADDEDEDNVLRESDLAGLSIDQNEIHQEELNLEEELKRAESMKSPDNDALLSARLPESPPSSRQERGRPDRHDSGSDSTPEDGLTLDINIDDLPNDPNTVSEDDNNESVTEVKKTSQINDVCLSSYTKECDLIADVLVNSWLKSNNSDLRNETIAAIGHISALLSREKLENITPSVVSSIIGLYRKISVPYNLTCTMAQLLAAIVQQEAHECLRPQLDAVMGSVLSQASVLPSYSEPNSMGNHSEALRCCHLISTAYPAQMGGQLLSRLENASHVQRVAALVVVRHLLSCR